MIAAAVLLCVWSSISAVWASTRKISDNAMSSSAGGAAQSPFSVDQKIDFKKMTADLWSAAAEEYSAKLLEKPTGSVPHLEMQLGRKLIVARVVTFLAGKENPVVLDVGAAGGEPALSMAKEMPHATIYGTDIAPGMVDMMRKRCEEVGVTNLEPRIEDGQALSSFDDGSVDVVTCVWGLESMPEHDKAIEQFHRVLKPGGMAILAVWDKDPNSIMVKVMRVMSTLGKAIPLSIQALGGDTGLKVMESAGFTEVKKTPIPIPLHVPSSFELRDLFPFMVKPTPVNGLLAAMEEKGRTDVREEACTIFQSEVLEDIAQGHAPTGPGLGRANEADPAFYMNALIVEGHRKGNM